MDREKCERKTKKKFVQHVNPKLISMECKSEERKQLYVNFNIATNQLYCYMRKKERKKTKRNKYEL